jgi:hypothetical protein
MENEIDFESTGTVTYIPNSELEKYKKQEKNRKLVKKHWSY